MCREKLRLYIFYINVYEQYLGRFRQLCSNGDGDGKGCEETRRWLERRWKCNIGIRDGN